MRSGSGMAAGSQSIPTQRVLPYESSAIDGGPSRVAQRAALQVLEPARADQETTALREVFCRKRNLMLEGLFGTTEDVVLGLGRELLAARKVPTLIEL